MQNIDRASHIPPEEVTENVSTISREIWQYVQTQSEAMALWVTQQYPQAEDNE